MTRRAKPLTAEQKAVIATVRRISKQRNRINDSYIAAVLKAREAGVTYAAIAEAAGTSSQAAQEIVRRHAKRNGSLGDFDDPTSAVPGSVTSANGDGTGVDSSVTGEAAAGDINGGASGVLKDMPHGAAAVVNEVGIETVTE